MDVKERIACRVAQELKQGDVVNLGIGLPTLVPNYLPSDVTITLQSENGLLGMGPLQGQPVPNLTNAGGKPCGTLPGAAFFDSAMSFSIIRGGHVDATVLGGLQVDQHGSLANWMVPGKMVPGMGGAMDLVTGAARVVVAMQHAAKGESKIVPRCTLPLTSARRVSLVVTDLAVLEPTADGLVLRERAPGVSIEAILAATTAALIVPEHVPEMQLTPA